MVTHRVKKTVSDDLVKKINLVDATIEAQMLESVSGEPIASIIIRHHGADCAEADPITSWDQLTSDLDRMSARMACRLHNTKLPEEEHQDCDALYF